MRIFTARLASTTPHAAIKPMAQSLVSPPVNDAFAASNGSCEVGRTPAGKRLRMPCKLRDGLCRPRNLVAKTLRCAASQTPSLRDNTELRLKLRQAGFEDERIAKCLRAVSILQKGYDPLNAYGQSAFVQDAALLAGLAQILLDNNN